MMEAIRMSSKSVQKAVKTTDEWDLNYTQTGVVIGLETHVQLNKLQTKLFCSL